MSRVRGLALLSLLTIGLFALVGCSSSDDDADASATSEGTAAATAEGGADETALAYRLADFEIVGPAIVAAGNVRFDVTNAGSQLHEFVIVRSDAAPDALPIVDALVPEDQLDLVGEIEEFAAGEERSSSFNLTPGTYLLICNIAGQYQLGMVAQLGVE